jgi:hypothetical protein
MARVRVNPNLLTSMDANLALHACHLHRRTPGMTVLDPVDVVIADSGLADDTFNIVTAAGFTLENADRRITETLAQLAHSRPYSWWVGPSSTPSDLSQRLQSPGLRHTATEAAMHLDLAQLPEPATVAGLEVKRVTTTEQLRDFATAIGGASPAETMIHFYDRTAGSALAAEAPDRGAAGVRRRRGTVPAPRIQAGRHLSGVRRRATLTARSCGQPGVLGRLPRWRLPAPNRSSPGRLSSI